MKELYEYRDNLLTALEKSVVELRRVADGIPDQAWYTPLDPQGHTPHFLLAQLRCIEANAFSVRMRRILNEQLPALELFSDEAWMADCYQPSEPYAAILDDYASLRQEELAWLAHLPPQGWNRTGRHPWWGTRALQWWVELSLRYTLQYMRQLQAAASK